MNGLATEHDITSIPKIEQHVHFGGNFSEAIALVPATTVSVAGCVVVRPRGPLEHLSFEALIEEARRLREAGVRQLCLDLSAVPEIGLSGLVALYAVAELFDGRPIPDLSAGWETIRRMLDPSTCETARTVELSGLRGEVATAVAKAGLLARFRLVQRQPDVLAGHAPAQRANASVGLKGRARRRSARRPARSESAVLSPKPARLAAASHSSRPSNGML